MWLWVVNRVGYVGPIRAYMHKWKRVVGRKWFLDQIQEVLKRRSDVFEISEGGPNLAQ